MSSLMISLGSLLLLHNNMSSSSAAAAAGSGGCVSLAQLNVRADRFVRTYWRTPVPPNPHEDTRTCAQAATEIRGELRNRSLSPWTYRLDQKDNRFPRDIFVAKCLCEGCIINQREDMSYNSVQVVVNRKVMLKTQCKTDQNKYKLTKEFIDVAVGCTCAVPKSLNG